MENVMKFKSTLFAIASILVGIGSASAATTIDTTGTWDGSINNGWYGSGQSLTVGAVDNTLDSISFYFDAASNGKTFNFTVGDALTGGTTFFSTSVLISTGINTINVGASLLAGSTIYALFDYGGFSGNTAKFSYTDGYAGGQSLFYSSLWDSSYTGLDHKFIAKFSGGVNAVPIPAALFMLAPALLGFMGLRRKAKSAVA